MTSSYDREGATSTGKSRIGLGVRHNNFLGLDDTLISGYTFGDSFWGRYAYHSIPVTSQGATLMYGYSVSKSIPKKEFAVFGIVSASQDYSISLHQDLFKKDEYLGEVYVGFDANDKTTELNTGTYSRDRLRIFNFGGTYTKRGFGSSLSVSPKIDQAVNCFGASSGQNPLASRGAISRYTKFTLNTNYKKLLPLNMQFSQKLMNGLSSSKLTPQQEFSIGGIDSVRGYPAGDYLADCAFISNSELLMPSIYIPQSWRLPYAEDSLRNQTTTVVFFDYGWGQRRGALDTEKKQVNDMGVGAGIRVSMFNQALLRLEWGYPVGDHMLTEGGNSQFHFSVDFQEKLPEEIERIKKFRQDEATKKIAREIVDEELKRKNSLLKEKIDTLRAQAKAAWDAGRLEEAKSLYERIDEIAKSVYQQAEDYVAILFQKEDKLGEAKKLASAKFQEGKLKEAKQLWQKIYQEAKPEPLVFEF
jgi:hemolysin activation/secretion protein